MATTYRSYDIVPHRKGGFTWTDERGSIHYSDGATETPYGTEEAAMDDIDGYRKHIRAASSAA